MWHKSLIIAMMWVCAYTNSENYLIVAGKVFFKQGKQELKVLGYASTTENAEVHISLEYKGKQITVTKTNVANSNFEAELGPFIRPLCPGKWRLTAQIIGAPIKTKSLFLIGTPRQIAREEKFLKIQTQRLIQVCKDILNKKNALETLNTLQIVRGNLQSLKKHWLFPTYPKLTNKLLTMVEKLELASQEEDTGFSDELIKELKLTEEEIKDIEQESKNSKALPSILKELQQLQKPLLLQKSLPMLAKEIKILSDLYSDLERNIGEFSGYPKILKQNYMLWKMWAKAWQLQLLFLESSLKNNASKNYLEVHQNAHKNIQHIKELWYVYSLHLLRQGFKVERKFTLTLKNPQSLTHYVKIVVPALQLLSFKIETLKKPLKEELKKYYNALIAKFKELEQQYRVAKKQGAKWSLWLPKFTNDLQKIQSQLSLPDYEYFYPNEIAKMLNSLETIMTLSIIMDNKLKGVKITLEEGVYSYYQQIQKMRQSIVSDFFKLEKDINF